MSSPGRPMAAMERLMEGHLYHLGVVSIEKAEIVRLISKLLSLGVIPGASVAKIPSKILLLGTGRPGNRHRLM